MRVRATNWANRGAAALICVVVVAAAFSQAHSLQTEPRMDLCLAAILWELCDHWHAKIIFLAFFATVAADFIHGSPVGASFVGVIAATSITAQRKPEWYLSGPLFILLCITVKWALSCIFYSSLLNYTSFLYCACNTIISFFAVRYLIRKHIIRNK
jgi:hypothetical protein